MVVELSFTWLTCEAGPKTDIANENSLIFRGQRRTRAIAQPRKLLVSSDVTQILQAWSEGSRTKLTSS